MTVRLRGYQGEMVLAIEEAWADGVTRPAVIAPTGSGKTLTFCALIVRQEATFRRRPVVLVARDELVKQTVATLEKVRRPHQKIGVIQGPRDDSRDSHIVVASVQTISKPSRLAKFDPARFDLIVCDEAHWSDSPTWRRVLEYFGAFERRSLVVGLTATMARTGRHKLGEIFDEIVWERDTRWCIDQGFLVRPRAITVAIPELDLSQVKTHHGDLSEADLAKAMASADAGPFVAKAYLEHARNEDGELRRGICFTPTIATAEAFMADFRAAGIPTELVIGSTPPDERDRHYEATRRGTNKVLMSVAVLTTGFDLPAVEVAVMARPTKAAHLYIQCVGRALRLSPETGKQDALILDVVGASRLGLASIADLRIHEDLDPNDNVQIDDLPMGGLRIGKPIVEVPDDHVFVEVDPFSGLRKQAKRNAERFKKNFLWTNGGVMFLPMVDAYVALHHQPDGLWTVCEVPHRGSTICQHRDLTLAAAMDQAAEMWGSMPSALKGPASSDQMMYLTRLGVDFDAETVTKQEASDLINVAKASKRLDK